MDPAFLPRGLDSARDSALPACDPAQPQADGSGSRPPIAWLSRTRTKSTAALIRETSPARLGLDADFFLRYSARDSALPACDPAQPQADRHQYRPVSPPAQGARDKTGKDRCDHQKRDILPGGIKRVFGAKDQHSGDRFAEEDQSGGSGKDQRLVSLSALFLFTIASLHRYIRFRRMDWSVAGSMLRFSLPLIPTTLFWRQR